MSKLKPFFIMENQKEIWKDIPNYEGFYQVSNLGRVKSLKRYVKFRHFNKLINERILSPSKDGGGYFQVVLNKEKNRKTIKIHQIVAMAFLNHKRCGYGQIIDHIDNDRLNNNVLNLQITTPRHNASKDVKNKTSKYTGVCWAKQKNKWKSYIKINGVLNHLGLFDCEAKAHEAYQNELNNIIKL